MIAKTIRAQLLFVSLLPLVLVVIAICVFMLADSINDIEIDLENRGNEVSNQAVLMSEFHFYTGNVERLKEVANIISGFEDVVYVRFEDSTKQILIESKSDVTSRSAREEKLFLIPIYSRNLDVGDVGAVAGLENTSAQNLGSIAIGISRNSSLAQREAAYLKVLLIALCAIVLGGMSVFIFGRNLSRSLTATMAAAKSIKRGGLRNRSPEDGSGEMLEFQQAFNKMLVKLEENESEMQYKIDQATSSLNELVVQLSSNNMELEATRQESIELAKSKAISDERARIMKDMHDGIGGQLVASLAMIEKEKNSEIRENISSALRECLDDFRLIINSLNLRDSNLTALLADFKYRISKKLNRLDVTLNWVVDDELDHVIIQPQQSLHLLRILQEAFTNILKHAGAKNIDCRVNCESGLVRLVVADDGDYNGCAGHGHGVNNMNWRAGELAGALSIEVGEGGGCVVNLAFPAEKMALIHR